MIKSDKEEVEDKIISKKNIEEDYILDIYVFGKECNSFPNLETKKD
ncbi:hypothetical protein [Miniphocaeibacter massiliensis]|nr:hypothetical protein [Miniphocaeibacter massiliensis]